MKSRFALGVGGVWLAASAILLGVGQWLHWGVWPLEETFKRWDGGWYLSIVQHGYTYDPLVSQSNVVFFPLYPLLARGLTQLTQWPPIDCGLVVSVAAFMAALVVFYDLARRRYDESVARWATVLLAFTPFGLFFGFMYTESLFLLLTVLTFWLMERQRWWLAAVAAGLAGGTRSIGIIAGLVLVLSWTWQYRAQLIDRRRWWRYWPMLVGLGLVSASGLLAFSGFLWWHNHDPLAFVHVQKYWGRVGVGNLRVEAENAWRQTVTHHFARSLIFAYGVWYGSVAAGLTGLGLLLWQREWRFALYVALGIAVPLLSGTVGSMNRYVIVLFPIYLAIARQLRGWLRWLVVAVSGLGFVAFWLIYLEPRHLFFG